MHLDFIDAITKDCYKRQDYNVTLRIYTSVCNAVGIHYEDVYCSVNKKLMISMINGNYYNINLRQYSIDIEYEVDGVIVFKDIIYKVVENNYFLKLIYDDTSYIIYKDGNDIICKHIPNSIKVQESLEHCNDATKAAIKTLEVLNLT